MRSSENERVMGEEETTEERDYRRMTVTEENEIDLSSHPLFLPSPVSPSLCLPSPVVSFLCLPSSVVSFLYLPSPVVSSLCLTTAGGPALCFTTADHPCHRCRRQTTKPIVDVTIFISISILLQKENPKTLLEKLSLRPARLSLSLFSNLLSLYIDLSHSAIHPYSRIG
ncbi:hypothetical protein L6452_22529 [Arctium lappa]|uniref:Uncharacterized protein n=1 Tax=Arctium lappa TaxID=4217 RepID=A0ACB9B0E5_ARCLA|nr:hypothetical protein L6452_22529 [Arctium lappa]